jgi:bifunctional UDP-N-acetylglucosamine pyrophosphorylase/glucosamine-1-phosphate N-acetyltransferase
MWWKRLEENAKHLRGLSRFVDESASVAETATLEGEVRIGPRSKICAGAFIQGPAQIGADCLIGNNAMVRGPLSMGDGTRIGFSVEIKNAVIGSRVGIGPLCYVADSVIEDEAYLGAMVRTSNHRLDRQTVKAMVGVSLHDTGLEKLGAHIGAHASLGIQVIILPGRAVASGSLFGPRITIDKNYPSARYLLKQELRVEDTARKE